MNLDAALKTFFAELVRLAALLAVFTVNAGLWSPVLAPEVGQGQEADVLIDHSAHHGSASANEAETPLDGWACALVCAGGQAAFSDLLASPLQKVLAFAAPLSGGVLKHGQTPDPDLRPPRSEALS
jgi:hypothetical protein